MRKLLWWTLISVIALRLSLFLLVNKTYFLRQFDPEYFGQLYSESQYVKGELSEGGIGDDGLYAFAGYYYLFQAGDVSSVNFEHPPIGKYLIGVSIFLFKNENVINILYFILLLLVTYKMGKMVLKDNVLALIPLVLVSTDPLFLDNLIRSLLDLPFTLFFTLAVYFFLKGFNKSSNFYLSSLFWGFAFSTRFFPLIILIYLFFFFITYFYYRGQLVVFIKASFLIPIIYLVSHFSFFVYHPSVVEFVAHKKWMIAWFFGSPRILGNFLRNILTGSYIDPTGKLVVNQLWTPFLPLVSLLAVLRFRVRIIKKKSIALFTIWCLSVLYLIYATVLTTGVQKYLMHVYPLITILAVSHVLTLVKKLLKMKLIH